MSGRVGDSTSSKSDERLIESHAVIVVLYGVASAIWCTSDVPSVIWREIDVNLTYYEGAVLVVFVE